MGILGLLKKIEIENESEIFEKHPCRELDTESKVHYLNGIALVMNEDSDVSETEKKYLGTLVNSFELDSKYINESIEFAEEPDEKSVMEMLKAFSSNEVKYSFIIDCMMVANADGDFSDEEAKLIEQFFDLYDISSSMGLLTTLFGNFKTKDTEALAIFFQDNPQIDMSRFLYLFEYLDINISLGDEEKRMVQEYNTLKQKEILAFKFITPRFSNGSLDCSASAYASIATMPVNNEQFCIFLNEMYQDKKIKIETNGDIVIFNAEEYKEEDIFAFIFSQKIIPLNDDLILSNKNKEIVFNEKGVFVPANGAEMSKIVYVTILSALLFIEWISEKHSCKYSLTNFDGDSKGLLTSRYIIYYGNSFMPHSINYEFYKTMYDYFILDEDNTYKDDILIWSENSDEDNIEATKEYYSERTSFRFMKCN